MGESVCWDCPSCSIGPSDLYTHEIAQSVVAHPGFSFSEVKKKQIFLPNIQKKLFNNRTHCQGDVCFRRRLN